MTETSVDYGLNRFRQIKKAVAKARQLGIEDVGKRRELVIDAKSIIHNVKNPWLTKRQIRRFPSVAKENMREDDRVKDASINRHFKVYGSVHSNRRVIVESLHGTKPTEAEVERVLKGQENKTSAKDLRNKYEVGVNEIAKKVSELVKIPAIIAKKSRIWSDQNRVAYRRAVVYSKVKTAEFSRSGNAALYWLNEQLLRSGNHFDNKGDLKKPVLNISLHGMQNNSKYSFAIGGGVDSADPKIVEWFYLKMKDELVKAEIGGVIIIDKQGEYRGDASLERFRTNDITKTRHHPSFGENYNKIQFEIAKEYRTGENVEIIARVLSNVLSQFEEIQK